MIIDPSGITVTPPPPDSPDDPNTILGKNEADLDKNDNKGRNTFPVNTRNLHKKTSVNLFTATTLFVSQIPLGVVESTAAVYTISHDYLSKVF